MKNKHIKRIYIKNILELFADYRGSVVSIIIYMIILMIISYFLPFFSRKLIDEGFIKADNECIIRCVLCILGLNTAQIIINILRRKQAVHMNVEVKAKMQKEALQHLLKVKMTFFSDKNATSTYQCIEEDIDNIASIVNDSTISGITAIFSAIGGGIALFTIDWHLGLAVVLFTPVNILFSELYARKNNLLIKKTITLKKKYSSWYGETINGVREIRLFGLQNKKIKEMDDQLNELKDITNECRMVLAYNAQMQTFLIEVLKTLIYLLSGYFMIKSNLTVGSVVAFQSYMLMVSGSEELILGLFFSFFALLPHIKRYYDFIDEPEEKTIKKPIDFGEGLIEFRHVSFSYDNVSKELFNNININFPRGSKTVIVGDNGVGKTTFLNLLLALLEPISGDILVNGKKRNEVSLDEYRQLFSVVSQEIFLFHDTLKNNICLGKEISQDKLDNIIKDVNLEGVIEKYGLDYQVNQNGSNLSGGQKQKIALARALVMERPVLIFDEATANLDKSSIKRFIELFHSRLKNTTVICVSHSDEIIEFFDRKMFFLDGSVIIENKKKLLN